MIISALEKRIEQYITEQLAVGLPLVELNNGAGPVRCITFKEYMGLCLYDEQGGGYYRAGPVRVGRGGDFYTSSGIGEVLAESLVQHLASYSQDAQEELVVMEWGAGTGRLSRQLNEIWNRRFTGRSCGLKQVIVEDHPAHMQEARLYFSQQSAKRQPQVQFLTSKEAMQDEKLWQSERTVVIANELLDAFPVHRIVKAGGELVELGVAGTAEAGFYYVHMPLSDERITARMKQAGISLLEGQITELNLDAELWLEVLAKRMGTGRIMIIDYGHEAQEYMAEHRMQGTFMCYSQHSATDNPFIRIGKQDMTAHVPFTFIRQAAESAGWQVSYYDTQKQFLIDHGVLELLRNHTDADPFSEASRMNRAVRQLLLSDGMSEAFKVLILDR